MLWSRDRARSGATGVYALSSAHPLVVVLSALGGGVGVALAIGAIAGSPRPHAPRAFHRPKRMH
jgi:hypothetical protein